MPERQWKLEVTELGGADTLHEAVVRARTWVAALQAGRKAFGEPASIPPGASCQVGPDGIVMVYDVIGRRSYQLSPLAEAPAQTASSSGSTPPSSSSSSPPPTRGRDARPRPSSPPVEDAESTLSLLDYRDQEPSDANPLTFRERVYAVTVPLHPGTAEQLAIKLLRRIQAELAGRKGAKFVHLAIFDHEWKDRPKRPPVVRLQWKDWRRAIDIEFPLEEATRSSVGHTHSKPPPSAEDRLAIAFEACRDLLFLGNRAEACEFAIRLLDELVPSDAAAACLFDINTDEFRFVATGGMGAQSRRGRSISSDAGLFGAAASLSERKVLELANASQDDRFDPDVDGISGLEIEAALYAPLIFEGRLVGMLQLVNGPSRGLFGSGDREVLNYVAEQLAAFVASIHSRPPAPAANRSLR